MDTAAWLVAGASFLIGAGMAGGAVRWWFGRRLRAAAVQQEKLEKARQFSAQQASQARRQIEVLQQDIAILRLSAAKRGQRPQPAVPAADGDAAAGANGSSNGGASDGWPGLAPDGFADTQVLSPNRR